MANRSVVILSPYFPPSTLAGVHRARHLAKHLPTHGWKPIVLCVDEAYHEQRLDPDLAKLMPESIETVKVPALPARLTSLFGFGEISLRAWRPLRRALFHLLDTRPIDAVIITGSPFYPMLFAEKIKRRYSVPVVLDFQDPWVSRWGMGLPKWSKGGLSHRLATWLEPKCVAAADHIVSVSETQNAELRARYAFLDESRMSAIPIGGDPNDFATLRTRSARDTEVALSSENINLSYVGTLLPRAGEVLRCLFEGIKVAIDRKPELGRRLRVHFVGTSNQPNGYRDHQVTAYAEAAGVQNLIDETPQRVSYLQALQILAKSDGILLFGSDERHYTASKIYPALLSGSPAIGIFHAQSSSFAILKECHEAKVIGFSSIADLHKKTDEIARGILSILERRGSAVRQVPTAVEPYLAVNIARQFADIFTSVAGG